MGTRKVKYTDNGVGKLPNDKPVLYRIETQSGKLNYTGIAKKGRVPDRIKEHVGKIPGSTVKIEQFSSIKDAANKEARVIKLHKPKYNEKGKK